MEQGQLPDWLASLREQQLSGKAPAAEQPIPDWLADLRGQRPEPQPEAESPAPTAEPPPGPAVRPDLLGDLRQQIALSSEEEARPRRKTGGLGLTPYQRFVLAFLLFCEVAICGCLLLVLTERVVF